MGESSVCASSDVGADVAEPSEVVVSVGVVAGVELVAGAELVAVVWEPAPEPLVLDVLPLVVPEVD